MAKKKSSPKKSASKKATAKKKSSKAGIRYTDKEKAEIVQFVRDYDRENNRGGQSAAVKKFGVSALSISNWLKKSGKPAVAKKKAVGRPRAIKPASGSGVLQRMIAIQEQLEALQGEFDALKKQL